MCGDYSHHAIDCKADAVKIKQYAMGKQKSQGNKSVKPKPTIKNPSSDVSKTSEPKKKWVHKHD